MDNRSLTPVDQGGAVREQKKNLSYQGNHTLSCQVLQWSTAVGEQVSRQPRRETRTSQDSSTNQLPGDHVKSQDGSVGGDGPEILHFQQAPKGLWCPWARTSLWVVRLYLVVAALFLLTSLEEMLRKAADSLYKGYLDQMTKCVLLLSWDQKGAEHGGVSVRTGVSEESMD